MDVRSTNSVLTMEKKELVKMGLETETTVEITNPINGNKALVTISRTGTTDEKLAAIMLHPDATRDQKDSFVSNYLMERGKDSSSFIAEIFRYKGAHTKETRAFKSQMNFTLEAGLNDVSTILRDNAESALKLLWPDKTAAALKEEAYIYLKENREKGKTILDFIKTKNKNKKLTTVEILLIEQALRSSSGVDMLLSKIKALATDRERANGYGIYIDKSGKPYSIFEDSDAELDAVIAADRARRDELARSTE